MGYIHLYMDRKNKISTDIVRKNKANSLKKSYSTKKHLLTKPNKKFSSTLQLTSASKNTQSFSTFCSHNYSKTMLNGHNAALAKQKRGMKNKLKEQINRIQDEFRKQFFLFQKQYKIDQQNKQNKWFEIVQNIVNKIQNNNVRELLTSVQLGYRTQKNQPRGSQEEKIQKVKNSELNVIDSNTNSERLNRKQKQQRKQKKKLTLNIAKIDKQNIKQYHEQFISKVDEFSPSWRGMLAIEEKRTR